MRANLARSPLETESIVVSHVLGRRRPIRLRSSRFRDLQPDNHSMWRRAMGKPTGELVTTSPSFEKRSLSGSSEAAPTRNPTRPNRDRFGKNSIELGASPYCIPNKNIIYIIIMNIIYNILFTIDYFMAVSCAANPHRCDRFDQSVLDRRRSKRLGFTNPCRRSPSCGEANLPVRRSDRNVASGID